MTKKGINPGHTKWEQGEYYKALPVLIELRNKSWSFNKIAIKLNNQFDVDVNEHIAKRAYNKYKNYDFSEEEKITEKVTQDIIQQDANDDISEEEQEYKKTYEILKDGAHRSDKLIRMTEEELKDEKYLLEAHGFDVNKWILVTAKNNIWNTYSKQDGIQVLYASKITVKPLKVSYSFDDLIAAIKEEPSKIIKNKKKEVVDQRLLEIPIYDSHFGVSNMEDYKKTQDDILDLIESKRWEEIVFIIGQDLLHNDNFKGQTANGTQIEEVNIPNAWRDAKQFYYPLIDAALDNNSNHVKIIYSKGNHDESMSWAFVQVLKERYPQVEFDDSFIERKAHTFGEIFIGVTHGDRARKNLHNLFQVEFPLEWASAKTREVHMGHLHTEDAKDWFGTMVRTLATRNKTDKWHKDNGFVGNHKRFMLFEYSTEELKSIHYV